MEMNSNMNGQKKKKKNKRERKNVALSIHPSIIVSAGFACVSVLLFVVCARAFTR